MHASACVCVTGCVCVYACTEGTAGDVHLWQRRRLPLGPTSALLPLLDLTLGWGARVKVQVGVGVGVRVRLRFGLAAGLGFELGIGIGKQREGGGRSSRRLRTLPRRASSPCASSGMPCVIRKVASTQVSE